VRAVSEAAVLPKLRERLKEVREKIKLPRAERAGRGRVQIGRGALIERLRKRATEVTERVQEFKPGIVPRIGEVLSAWYPGKRLVTILTPKTELVRPGELIQQEAKEKVKPPEGEGRHY
jgi:tetrahydromethanopterin S-methyltransferase subunit G